MKQNLIFVLFGLLFSNILNCQVPQAFSFQGVAFDGNGNPINSQMISVKVGIIENNAIGIEIYSETHIPTTNQFGLYSLNIGQGQNPTSSFSEINWLNGNKFISLAIDPNGGTNYQLVGINQLLSVPYALAAGEAAVKPKIKATFLPINETILFLNDGYIIPPVDLSLQYQWIDGTPEDIYVVHEGLPEGIGLVKKGFAAYANYPFNKYKYNYSTNIDTIEGGVFHQVIGYSKNPFVNNIQEGVYDINVKFKTKDLVLDSIPYRLILYAHKKDVCPPMNKDSIIIKAVDCDSLSYLIGTKSIVDVDADGNLVITNFLGSNKVARSKDIFINSNATCSFSFENRYDDFIPNFSEIFSSFLSNSNLLKVSVSISSESNPNHSQLCVIDYE